MIFTGFHSNANKQDLLISLKYFWFPWNWNKSRKGTFTSQATQLLQNYFGGSDVVLFDSGRTALQKALEAFKLPPDSEILVQGYTCMVVSNAINWAKVKPVYVDVQDDFNMDPEDLERKITHNSRVIIIQHTFGKPADIEKIVTIAKKHNLLIIEDCAHSLGALYKQRLTGTWGDIGMFSFGTDKVVSAVRGGALVINNDTYRDVIKELEQQLPDTSWIKIMQYLANIPAFFIGKFFYNKLNLGKIFLFLLKEMRITGRIMYEREKKGEKIPFYPTKMPNALAEMLINQLTHLDSFNTHRQKIAQLYKQYITNDAVQKPQDTTEHIFLRYTILVDNPEKLHKQASQEGILLGNWYNTVIAPRDCDITKSGYISGDCPKAEKLSSKSINLPTNKTISEADAQKIIELVNKYDN